MTQQTINVGTTPNDGTGDTVRNAFIICNANFTDLYADVAANEALANTAETNATAAAAEASQALSTANTAITDANAASTAAASASAAASSAATVAAEALAAATAPKPVALAYSFTNGALTALQVMYIQYMPFAVTLPAGLTGSIAACTVAPANDSTFAININGTQVGTLFFASGQTSGTFTFASDQVIEAGQSISITAPAVADPGLANPSITLLGTRS